MDIFSSIFGPSKDEIWGKLAGDIGGWYENVGLFGRDVLRYRSGEWEITLDTYTVLTIVSRHSVAYPYKYNVTHTRMRAPFINKDGLYFKIYREGFFSAIGKSLGMQDIEIGDPYFDNEFIIKGNNTEKIKMLLADPELKNRIQKQPDINFKIKDDEGWFGTRFPKGVDELYFECYGVLKDEALLKNLFEMFCITLQRLVQIDSAYKKDPIVRL